MTQANDLSQLVSLSAASPGESVREKSEPAREALFGLDATALAVVMTELGEPAWRRTQIAQAIYNQRVMSINEITTLSKALRGKLSENGWEVGRPQIEQVFQSVDGTERYLVRCLNHDGRGSETVETVWMPEGDEGEAGDGTDSGSAESSSAPVRQHEQRKIAPELRSNLARRRATICVSSQVGCAVNCQFCLTAKLGLQRNLTVGEIAGQVVAVLDRQGVEVGRDRVNLVFMGMGEPFLNYDNFMGAVRLLVKEVGLSPQRMTVSTSGILPGMERFLDEPIEFRPKLAISLNAPNDQIRQELMPINKKWNIQALLEVLAGFKLRPRERVTFEYVLLAGVTDKPMHAKELAGLIRKSGLAAKVNLIAWNPGPGIGYTMPSPEAVEAFKSALMAEDIPAYLRRPRGRDIYAACGQLKRTVEG